MGDPGRHGVRLERAGPYELTDGEVAPGDGFEPFPADSVSRQIIELALFWNQDPDVWLEKDPRVIATAMQLADEKIAAMNKGVKAIETPDAPRKTPGPGGPIQYSG